MKFSIIIFSLFFIQISLSAQLDSVKINSINIVGNETFSSGKLNELMSTKESNLLVNNYFIEDDFLEDLEILEKFYHHEGFFDFEISDYSTLLSEDKSELDIAIDIDEGNAAIIDSIIIVGNSFFLTKEIFKKINIFSGDRFRQVKVNSAKSNIKKMYLNTGFLDIEVDIGIRINKVQDIVELTFSIQENERFSINEIVIEGIESTKEYVVTRELDFAINDFISLDVLGETLRDLYRTGLFSSVSIKPIATSDSSLVKKNILVKLEESEPGVFEFSVGFGTIEKFSVFSEISYNNILGRAYRARLGGKISHIEKSIKPSITDPWILGIPWSLSLSGELSYRTEPSYSLTYYNGQIHFFKEFRRRSRFGFTFNSGKGYMHDISPSLFEDVIPDTLTNDELDFIYNYIKGIHVNQIRKSFKVTLVLDERNNLFNPDKGFYLNLSTEYIWGSSAVDTFRILSSKVYNNILRSEATAKYFHSTSKQTTIVSSFNIGIIKNFSEDEIIFLLDDLFYVGGPNTIRGFGYKLVGPLTSNNDPMGGRFKIVWNVFEIRQRIFWIFGAVLFADIGNVWSKPEDFNLNSLRYSAGLGLRIDTPIGLARFDYGFNPWPQPGESNGQFWFGIGHAF